MSEAILRIIGEVAQQAEFSFAELQQLPAEHQISDVRQLDPARSGQAVRLEALLERVQPSASAAWLTLHASADDFHASIPLAEVRERGVVIYAIEGQPLPAGKGGPMRFFIPNHAACQAAEIDECANVKFVDCMELTTHRGHDNRPHDEAEHEQLHARQQSPPLG